MGYKKSLFVCLLLIALFMTACTGNSYNDITVKKANNLSNAPTHLSQKLGKHVNLNADVVIPEEIKSIPVLKASIYSIDPSKLKETLIGKQIIITQKNSNGSIQELAYGQLCDTSGNPILVSDILVDHGKPLEQENDKLLLYGAGQTIFMTTEYNYTFMTFQRDAISGSYSADQYKKKSLPFMSPSNAFGNVVKTIGKLGLDVHGTHSTYCLDNQTSSDILGYDPYARYTDYVSNVYQTLENKGEWGVYDDYYYFVLYPKYHGIPIAEGDGSSIEGGTLDVAYCERGIEYLMANSLYKETGVLQSDVPVYGLAGALQMLKYKYDNTILTEPVTVSSIRFCYVPVPMSKNSTDYRLVPGWQFTIKKVVMNVNGETEASNFGNASAQMDTINIYFDATTGKEIIGSTPRL